MGYGSKLRGFRPDSGGAGINNVLTGNAVPGGLESWVVRHSGYLALGIIAAAFALRLICSASCYLNPDEAQHFNAARASTWLGAYEASRELAHPPLFILALHGMMAFGRGELILRAASLIAGTAALWLTFAWIRRSLGEIPALGALLFMALSPAAVSASTEVRQYGLLLCFVCGSLYATERALVERSTTWAIIQGLCLVGALLTHYTALVAIASLGLYVLVHCFLEGVPRRFLLTIGAVQLFLAAVLGWLYFDHIRGASVFNSAPLYYLQQIYFRTPSETLLGYSWRALVGTFSYTVSLRFALLSMLIFLVGFAAILTRRTEVRRHMALLVISPFAVGYLAAICQVFPFAGSRHQTYLLPFLAAGFAAVLAWMKRSLPERVLLLPAILAPLWLVFGAPDNNPRFMAIGDMRTAIEYLHRRVPVGTPIFVDDETKYLLMYYLAQSDANLDNRVGKAGVEWIGGYRVVTATTYVWAFRPDEALRQVEESARALGISTTDPLWIVSVAWLSPSLASRIPPGRRGDAKEFGSISVIETSQARQL